MRWRVQEVHYRGDYCRAVAPWRGVGGLLLQVDRISLSETSSSSVSVILAELES